MEIDVNVVDDDYIHSFHHKPHNSTKTLPHPPTKTHHTTPTPKHPPQQDTKEVSVRSTLNQGPIYGVAFLAWSPDSKLLISCGTEDSTDLVIWDAFVSIDT